MYIQKGIISLAKQENILIRLTDKEKEKIKLLAEKHNLSVSEYIRIRSLNRKIRKQKKELNEV